MALDATSERLAARRWPEPDPDPAGASDAGAVVAVHGFAQSRDCLGPMGDAIAARHQLTAVDAPGHGGSALHADADLWRGAELLVATGGAASYLGYSMGGRLCLHAALAAPESVERLVLVSCTAGIEEDRARAERVDWDEQHAARLEEIGLEAFVEEWLAQSLFAGLPSWARFDEERRGNSVEGLAASLRRAGTGSMEPLWDRLPEIGCPVLVVTGSRDERYGELGARMAATIGANAHHVVVPGAGHSAHLERPSQTTAAVLEFLAA